MPLRRARHYKDFHIFINGIGYAGIATEVTLPEIAEKTSDHRGAGMGYNLQFKQGLEDLEMTIKTKDAAPELSALTAKHDAQATSIILYAHTSTDESPNSGQNLTVTFQGSISKRGSFSLKSGEEPEIEFTVKPIIVYTEVYDGRELYHIDLMSTKYRVDGVDQWAQMRANLRL